MDRVLRVLRASVLLASGLSAASASDWYVDGAAGNNGNTGASPGEAWKTITHALASTPQTGTQTIHVAPGTYDAGLGETFPWSWRPSLSLVGDQGTASTIVVGSPGIPVMRMASTSGSGWVIGNDTLIQGITFQGGSSAIELASDFNEVSPTLRDLAITNTSFAGILVETFGGLFAGAASPVLLDVAISNCALGMAVSANGAVSATDCSFLDNAGSGVVSDRSQLSLERCRIEDSGGWGLVFTSGEISLHATTIARNTGGIWGAPAAPAFFLSVATATKCTIADNGSIGVRTDNSSTGGSDVVLDSTIIHGHLDDLALASGSTVQYCEIGDGELAGTAGNFQADPQFVNAAAGNYQLLPGSPCIDAGNPALPIEADCSLADVGAHSFAQAQSQAYCTAKLNSCLAFPAIGASGTPSATAASGFLVLATGTKALAHGMVIYSTSGPASVPFQGGTLCLAEPVRRSVMVVDTSGTPGHCNGMLSLDMNAFAAGSLGGSPSPALRVPGTRVDCQYWARDGLAGSLLSDALEYFVCP